MHSVFSEFALLLIISAGAGAMALWLRQPVLIAYIVAGPASRSHRPRTATDAQCR